jgi:hypothetical protein
MLNRYVPSSPFPLLGLGTGVSAPSGQDVSHRDLADLDAIDLHGQPMAGREDLVRLIAVRSRVGVDLELAVVHVDDPVDGDPRLRVDGGQRLVFVQAGDRHLGDQGYVGRVRPL